MLTASTVDTFRNVDTATWLRGIGSVHSCACAVSVGTPALERLACVRAQCEYLAVVGLVEEREHVEGAVEAGQPHVDDEEEEVAVVVLPHAVPYPRYHT